MQSVIEDDSRLCPAFVYQKANILLVIRYMYNEGKSGKYLVTKVDLTTGEQSVLGNAIDIEWIYNNVVEVWGPCFSIDHYFQSQQELLQGYEE